MSTAGPPTRTRVDGPFFDDLAVGQVVASSPGLTLTAGHAALHQAIVGDRLPLATDEPLARSVAGGPLAHPALVWDVAIGGSTPLTHRVVANLFYRGLVFHRFPRLGDTLRTRAEVVGLRQNRTRPTGVVALRVTTRDQEDRTVLDFTRAAMVPLSAPDVDTGHADDVSTVGPAGGSAAPDAALGGWSVPASGSALEVGTTFVVPGGDVVTSAPELARLTLNVARVHHDHRAGSGQRLVYGGHTIGIALSQACRALPDLLTVLAWDGCDHTGPVYEQDVLTSTLEVTAVRRAVCGGRLVDLRSVVSAVGEPARPVLDWRFTALLR